VGEFLDALHRVAAGGSAFDPEIVAPVCCAQRATRSASSPRRARGSALMAEGRSNSAIAGALVVGGGAGG